MPIRTLAIVKCHAHPNAPAILAMAETASLVPERHNMRFEMPVVLAMELYKAHVGKPYYDALIDSVTVGPTAVAILGGENAVARWRAAMGFTNPIDAAPGTVRAMYGNRTPGKMHENAVHGSDSEAAAEREIELFFGSGR